MIQKYFLVIITILFCNTTCFAQIPLPNFDTTKLDNFRVTNSDTLYGVKTNETFYNRLLGNVVIIHNDITMTCDSAHFYLENKFVEAWGNVTITNATGNSKADYVKYTGLNHMAYMKGNVQIIDGNNTLYTDELDYNIKTKIANYKNGGTLQADATTVNSERGTYNGFTKQCYFVKDVIITNNEYTITSNELTYNTNTKIVNFLDWSEIITTNGVINTRKGTYNSVTEKAVFTSRTRVENESQIIEANRLDYSNKEGSGNGHGNVIILDPAKQSVLFCEHIKYNKTTGYSEAKTKVIYIDTLENTSLYCDDMNYNKITGYSEANGHVQYFNTKKNTELFCHTMNYNKLTGYSEANGKVIYKDTSNKIELRSNKLQYNLNSSFIQATQKPKLLSKLDNDSMYLRADTILAFPQRYNNEIKYIKRKKETVYNLLYADSTYKTEDSSEKRIIVCNRTVKLYTDSSQAVCDSLLYDEVLEKFSLFKQPILWRNNQQASADTMYIFTTDNNIKKTLQLKNALVVKPQKEKTIYDQITGNVIESFFTKGEIDQVEITKNAESIYYAKDEDDAYIGMNKSEGSIITLYFENQELSNIKVIENPKGKFYPMNELTETNKYLENFILYDSRKPLSKFDILNDK